MPRNKEYEDLGEACYQGQLTKIQELLDAGLAPDGHEEQRDHERPLSLALVNRQFAAAQMLLDAGAKPRYGAAFLDSFLDDPQYEPFIERILDDAGPEIADALQKALVKAVESGNRAVAGRLWAACPSLKDATYRHSPLVAAIKSKQTEMALWLMERGFDHTSHAENETPPVTVAIVANEPAILRALFERGESPQRPVNGHQKVFTGSPALYAKLRHVREFPKNDKYEVFHNGNLLHVAAVAGSAECAKVLLEAGVDPNAVDSEGRTPAMLAAIGKEHTRGVLELLPEPDLSSGPAVADLLTRSLLDDDVEGVRKAIEHGADLSQPIASEYSTAATSLIIAACRGSIEVIRALLEGGAEIEQVDWPENQKKNAAGPRMLIENAGLDSLIGMPLTSARTPFGWAALYGQIEAMKCLIEAGADREARDVFQFTALHLAAIGDRPEAVRFLIDLGLDLHAEAFDETTPLHAAAEANAVKAIPVLIEAGADTTRKNKDGQTPYVVAKEYGKPGAYRKLEPHTPKEFQVRKRKAKKEPDWEWSRTEFDTLLKKARSEHGEAARPLATEAFRKKLAEAAKEEGFLKAAEAIRKKLKGQQLGTWGDVPHIRWMEGIRVTDAKLLRLQEEFLEKGVFVVRELHSRNDLRRVFIVPTACLFELVAAFGTNGVNMGLDPDVTIAWLMGLHNRHPYRVIGIMHDGLELRFDEPIKEPDDLVQELMIVCPPPMDENNERKRLLKKLSSRTPQVLLWWD